jgi:hypothetical protein
MKEIILKLTQNINNFYSEITVSIPATIVKFIEENKLLYELNRIFEIDDMKIFYEVETKELKEVCKGLVYSINRKNLDQQILLFRDKYYLNEEDISLMQIIEILNHIIYLCESSDRFNKVLVGYSLLDDSF